MVREQRLELAQHMTEHQTEFGQISPIVRVLIVHFLLALFEQLDGLLAFAYDIQYEHVEVLVGVQLGQVVLVLRVYKPEPLIGVGQYVQYERRRVFQVHFGVLAQFDHLVHELPRFLQRALVDGGLWRGDGLGERAVQLHQYGGEVPRLHHSVRAGRHHDDVRTHQCRPPCRRG